ncbi:MAG: WecB/TagA/CpsF family glycosyltransferase [Coleofasciculus sp. B1-GNL1-01]|uniref:WecB/TagA/CpsF family glycosyltransferase n=1 Tax=Coleofasciculus sp. B1-GNL1-01 TaxID=3068484 RepID=UPI0032F41838
MSWNEFALLFSGNFFNYMNLLLFVFLAIKTFWLNCPLLELYSICCIFLCGLAVLLFLVNGYLGMDKRHIVGSKVNLVSCNKATQKVLDWSGNRSSRYVCLANAHMIMEAYDSKKFWEILNAADLTLPDGMSLVGSLRILGVANQEQVCGRNLTLSLCEQAAKREIAVGFYGSSNKVLVFRS